MQLERTMAEYNGTDTDERLAEIFGKSPSKPNYGTKSTGIIAGPSNFKSEDDGDIFFTSAHQQ